MKPRARRTKILAPAALARKLAADRREGRRVVFTNGCFDLLHRGHVDYLERARALGDRLVVALNSDGSLRKLKGPGRPLTPLRDRQEVLAALECVDYVTSFGTDTPLALIRRLRPDRLVKGGDYRANDIVGAADVRAAGGRVLVLPLVKGRSTTGILARAKRGLPLD